MILPDDFRDFLRCLNARSVDYLVLGGHAVSFHGYPRFTHDIDLFVRPALDNADRLLGALRDFGFGAIDLKAESLAAAIRTMFERDDRGAALGAAGRLTALATFAPESVARRYADVYRSVVGNGAT